ncbi:MAG: mandelate racemase/muconate lactonizing enzyme family protein [Variovorax sp.]
MKLQRIETDLLRYRLAKPVGGSGVNFVDVLIVELALDNGVAGLGFSYVLSESGVVAAAACKALASRLQTVDFHHPAASWRFLNGTLNRTGFGPNAIALAAIDVALWDAYAKSLGQPLGCVLGGSPRVVNVYASGGYFAGQSADEVCAVSQEWAAQGFKAVKPRVDGSLRAIAALRSLRESLPADIEVMCDANEKCSMAQAQRLLHAAQELGVLFVEEPLPANDRDGYMALARTYPGRIAAGEHMQGIEQCLPWVTGAACGTFQPDLAMIGGLTPALELARIADAFGVEIAPHFLPGLFVHLAAACPNVAWLEDFPLIEPMFTGWPAVVQGRLQMTQASGHGLALGQGAKETFVLQR